MALCRKLLQEDLPIPYNAVEETQTNAVAVLGPDMIMRRSKVCKYILLLFICAFALSYSTVFLRAAGGVTVDLSFREKSSKAGEIVTLDVVFSSFPSITRFGPLEVNYEDENLEFVDAQMGPELVGFSLTYEKDDESALVRLTSLNESLEEAILQSAAETTGEGETTAKSSDPVAFNTEEPVIVATLRFRIKESARGEVKAWLGGISGLRDSVLENVVAGAGNSASLIVQAVVSSDATLSSLSVTSLELKPDFDPGIFEYEAVVSKNVSDVAVNAVAYNINSSVTVEGQSNLKPGNNPVTVTVKAEDGESVNIYTINIFQSDALSVQGISLQDKDGVEYFFEPLPETIVIPADFVQTTMLLSGKEVPCFKREGVKSALIYVKRNGMDPGLYAYNQDTGILRLYEPGKMLLRSSLILTVEQVPASVIIPEGFTPASIPFGNTEISGYVSKDKSTSIAYLKTEDGSAQFYVIDSQNRDFYPYKTTTPTQNLFLYLFIVCASIAVVEALIIGLMFYRRRHQFRRQAKPRRV